MNRIAVAAVVMIIAVSYAGLVSAHQSDVTDDMEFEDQYKEMLDLHKQYFNDKITFEELHEKMEDTEFYEDEMPCHGGYGMMGMMWH